MMAYGMYRTVPAAEAAVEALKLAGFEEAEVSTVYKGNVASKEIEEERITGEPDAGLVAGGRRFPESLVDLGFPENEARRYAGRITEGGVMVAVQCRDSGWAREALAILEHSGAEEISSLEHGPTKLPSSDEASAA